MSVTVSYVRRLPGASIDAELLRWKHRRPRVARSLLLLLITVTIGQVVDSERRGPTSEAAAVSDLVSTIVLKSASGKQLVLPASARQLVEKILALYAEVGLWEPARVLPERRREMITRMEEMQAALPQILPPIALAIGNGCAADGNASGALYWFAAAEAAAAASGDSVTAGIAAMNVGLAASKTEIPADSIVPLERAIAAFTGANSAASATFWLGNTVSELVDVLARTGRAGAALILLEKWLPVIRLTTPRAHLLRGKLAWVRGDPGAAMAAWSVGVAVASLTGDIDWTDRLWITAAAAAAVSNFGTYAPLGAEDNAWSAASIVSVGVQVGAGAASAALRAARDHIATNRSREDASDSSPGPVEGAVTTAIARLPWSVLGVTAAKRGVEWVAWDAGEDAATAIEALCAYVILQHAAAVVKSSTPNITNGTSTRMFDANTDALPARMATRLHDACLSDDTASYSLPYERIGAGGAMAPYTSVLLSTAAGIASGTVTRDKLDSAARVKALAALSTRTWLRWHAKRAAAQRVAARPEEPTLSPASLHVGILSYDLRAHASAWLAEGYIRYFDPSHITLSAWQYGPLDVDSRLQQIAATSLTSWRPQTYDPPVRSKTLMASTSPLGSLINPSYQYDALSLVMLRSDNASMTDRIVAAASVRDGFYVASPDASDSALCRAMLTQSSQQVDDGHRTAAPTYARDESANRMCNNGKRITTSSYATVDAILVRRLHIVDEHMGHTFGARQGMLRCAETMIPARQTEAGSGSSPPASPAPPPPLIISFMYPGSTGASHTGFIVADAVVAPPEEYMTPLRMPEPSAQLLQALSVEGHSRSNTTTRQRSHRVHEPAEMFGNAHANGSLLPRVLGQSFSERLILLPHAYTAHFYTCATPLLSAELVTLTRSDNQTANTRGCESHVPSCCKCDTISHPSNCATHSDSLALRRYCKRHWRVAQPVLSPVRFGCFNAAAKLDPTILSVWANILRLAPPGSTLVLLAASTKSATSVSRKLRNEAAARGIHPARLTTVPSLTRDAHVSRYITMTDLLLDPHLITGHTTTADALWAGVPTISAEIGGAMLAGRVSSSFLQASGHRVHAVTLVHSLLSYERAAVSLAISPHALKALRHRIAVASLVCPMLHWPASIAHLTRGYRGAWETSYLQWGATALVDSQFIGSGSVASATSRFGHAANGLRHVLPVWQHGGYHIVVDPDMRFAGAAACNAAIGASLPVASGVGAAARYAELTSARILYEVASTKALETTGYFAQVASCKVRLAASRMEAYR